jgi:hypothetical protein
MNIDWQEIVQKVSPYVVKIETQSGSGTGFLCAYNADKSWCAVATAFHVVSEAEEWQQPIKIYDHTFSKPAFLPEKRRVIFTDSATDSAAVLFPSSELNFPQVTVPLRPIDSPISIGEDVGWLGFPSIAAYTLCFFAGPISARQDWNKAYLIDGVAIPGVSGGPVVFSSGTDGVQFVGVVSAYRSSKTGGTPMPGLLIAQDVSHVHGVIQTIRSWDEAHAKKAEEEAKKKLAEGQSSSSLGDPMPEPK